VKATLVVLAGLLVGSGVGCARAQSTSAVQVRGACGAVSRHPGFIDAVNAAASLAPINRTYDRIDVIAQSSPSPARSDCSSDEITKPRTLRAPSEEALPATFLVSSLKPKGVGPALRAA
jgi:hypothetical protein